MIQRPLLPNGSVLPRSGTPLIIPVSFEGLLAPDIFVGLPLGKEDGDIEGISLVETMGVVAGRLFGDALGEAEGTPLVGLALGAEKVDPARDLLGEEVGESFGNELWDNLGSSEGKAVGPLEAEADSSCIVVLDEEVGASLGKEFWDASEFSEGKAVGPMEAEADSCIVVLDRVLLVSIE
jgi:hypothetical protein